MTIEKNHRLLLGAHMSTSGGYYKALERGHSIGCTAIQIFTKNNRQWHAKPITQHEASLFQETQQKLGIKAVVAHASYLINIGSDHETVEQASIKALAHELERCDLLSIPYLVLHPGSGNNATACLEKIITNLNTIFSAYSGNTMILLENMAGQGSTLGSKFQTLASIRSGVSRSHAIGFCFDTCHAFAAGYDFRDPITYAALWQEYDRVIGLKHLKAIHVNDSKKELASRVDRHEDIGKGNLGIEAFKLLVNDPILATVPKILETPKDTPGDDQRNMDTLMQLAVNT